MADENSAKDRAQRAAQLRAEALAAFPFERIEVGGDAALDEWERLKQAKRGAPVVIGGDEAFDRILEVFHPTYGERVKQPDLRETLAKADRLTHPDSLAAHRKEEAKRFMEWCRENQQLCAGWEKIEEQLQEAGPDVVAVATSAPPEGEWPEEVPLMPGLTVVLDWANGRPFDKVTIVVLPTEDWTTIPAHLRWGGWNANPPPEYHVAALRSWRDRYGAELIGLGPDTMNIRVATKPGARDEAMVLAREHYAYCNDIVDQGTGTLSNLAAVLKSHDWWFFWWD